MARERKADACCVAWQTVALAVAAALLAAAMLPATAAAEEAWSRFRGPNGSGVSEVASIPATWNAADYNWKLRLPGLGHASPVVWGERIFVLTADEETGTRQLACVAAADGSILWQRDFPAELHRKHKVNSFATSTPAADEQHVYAAWADGNRIVMKALRHADGSTAWEQDLGPFKGGHGFGASPIVYRDLVVIGNDQDGESSLLALDRTTGQLRWKTERNSRRTTYSTPCVYQPSGGKPLLIFTDWNHGISAIDPADGALAWERSVFGKSTERAIGSPIIAGDLVIGTCGFVTSTKHVVAVRPGQTGQETAVDEVYHLERGAPHIPTVVAYGDLLLLWADNGVVTCCNLADGRTHWQKRIGGTYMASPVCIAGRLYNISEDGEVVVLAASRTFEELGRVQLGERCHATPAIAGGALLIRTHEHLYSIGGRNQRQP